MTKSQKTAKPKKWIQDKKAETSKTKNPGQLKIFLNSKTKKPLLNSD